MPVFSEISVSEAHWRLVGERPPRLIDVREADEWDIARIAGAELLPFSQWPVIALQRLIDPAQCVLVYCHHGGRSARATAFLRRAGFKDVHNIAGGIDAWSEEIDGTVPRY